MVKVPIPTALGDLKHWLINFIKLYRDTLLKKMHIDPIKQVPVFAELTKDKEIYLCSHNLK